MMTIFPKSEEEKYPKGSRIFLINPKDEELKEVALAVDCEVALLKTALDENTLTRVHFNKNVALYVDIPFALAKSKQNYYKTAPIGIFLIHEYFVIVSFRPHEIFNTINSDLFMKEQKGFELVLSILNKIAFNYITYLKDYYQKTEALERQLKKNVKNNSIFQLMEYQRSLTAITTSIKGLKRLLNRFIENKIEFKQENILEDTIIAAEQAGEMAQIYNEDLDALIDAFGSIISNNLNQIMKILTSLTLIVAIPTLVAGIYGMNISALPLAHEPNAFWLIVGGSGIFSLLLGIIFYLKKML